MLIYSLLGLWFLQDKKHWCSKIIQKTFHFTYWSRLNCHKIIIAFRRYPVMLIQHLPLSMLNCSGVMLMKLTGFVKNTMHDKEKVQMFQCEFHKHTMTVLSAKRLWQVEKNAIGGVLLPPRHRGESSLYSKKTESWGKMHLLGSWCSETNAAYLKNNFRSAKTCCELQTRPECRHWQSCHCLLWHLIDKLLNILAYRSAIYLKAYYLDIIVSYLFTFTFMVFGKMVKQM